MLAEVDYIWALLQKDNILNVQLLTLKTRWGVGVAQW
jgi:hypothetical protein